jgi:hypothetical protein
VTAYVSFLQIVPSVFPAGVVTGMFCAFSAENQRGDRKTQTHRPSYTKQPTLKKICANLRHLRIKNVCYQSLIAYGACHRLGPKCFMPSATLLISVLSPLCGENRFYTHCLLCAWPSGACRPSANDDPRKPQGRKVNGKTKTRVAHVTLST